MVIDRLPARGMLRYGVGAVSAGQVVSAADLAKGLLSFTPAPGAKDAVGTSFEFRVQDDGGGRHDVDVTRRKVTISIDSSGAPLVTQAR